ncbi:MAG: porin [Azoarcus sp.]|nr:porin [Azoarcus sp.]
MQKKLIALAIAGLVSAPAFAQSSVTIYGTLDYGYSVQNRNVDGDVRSRQGVDGNVSKQSRLGFKVVEDLGNGLKVVGVLETGLHADNDEGLLKNDARQSYAALAGGFGTVAFGRHYTPQHLFTGAVDPFANNGLGAAGNALVKDKRLSNLVAYISPTWGGFSFITAYTNSYNANESNENKGTGYDLDDTRVWAFSPSYTNGGLFLAANYHQAKFNEPNPTYEIEHLRVYEAYASYDFGPVKLGALYGQRKTSIGLNNVDDIKLKQWLVGATWKITANDSLLVSYANRRVEIDEEALKRSDTRLGQWAIGYDHALSKRTTLYARYAQQYQNRAQKEDTVFSDDQKPTGALLGIAGYGATGVSTDAQFGGSGYRQGFGIGIRHDF